MILRRPIYLSSSLASLSLAKVPSVTDIFALCNRISTVQHFLYILSFISSLDFLVKFIPYKKHIKSTLGTKYRI